MSLGKFGLLLFEKRHKIVRLKVKVAGTLKIAANLQQPQHISLQFCPCAIAVDKRYVQTVLHIYANNLLFSIIYVFMNSHPCLNCGNTTAGSAKYCSHCGQNTHVHRFTIRHFFHEFFHAFTHADKGIFHLLKCLTLQPGTTAREYITGKRKKYFNPFTFFLILMAVFVLSNNFFTKPLDLRKVDPVVLQHIPTQEGKKMYVERTERGNTASIVMRKHGNIVAMVAVPFIAFFTWLFYRKRGFNYAEHLTANMMFVAFSNLIFTLVIFPLVSLVGNHTFSLSITIIAMLLQGLYLGWALNGFLQLKTTGQRMVSFFAATLIILLWALFSMMMIAIYIYQGADFFDFFSRMKG